MEVTFHNVTIVIKANTSRGAYNKLCDLLAVNDVDSFTTDTYSAGDVQRGDTSELW